MIEILKYQNNLQAEWDQFIDTSDNGTIFQKQKFLSYHVSRKFENHSLIFKKKGKIIAVFPAAIKQEGKKKILFSHPGASFGGIVYKNISFEECNIIIKLIEHEAHHNGCNQIFIIQTPTIYNTLSNNEIIDYCLRDRNFKNKERYLSSIIPINEDVNNQLKKISRNKNRTQSYYNNLIRKHELKFRWVDSFKEFYPILLKNKQKHNAKPTHSIEELERLKLLFPNEILQLMIYNNKQAIGGMTIFKTNNISGIIFYSMFDYNFTNIQPIILLMQYIIPWSKKNKIQFIDYGISHQPKNKNPLAPNKSLIKFKEDFGSFASIRNTYSKILNDK